MAGNLGVFAGLCTLDVVHQVDAAPSANEKVTARSQQLAAGGPATNAAVTYAALGGSAVLVTALGRGAAADLIRADLAACSVQVVDVAAEQTDRVPISSIVVSGGGQRSIVSLDGAGTVIEDVADLVDIAEGAEVVLVDGHHPAVVERAARAARQADVRVVVDAGRWRPVMNSLLPNVDVAICSADFRHPDAVDAVDSARILRTIGVHTVVVTDGAAAIRWWRDGATGSVEPPAVPVLDTAGAGDVFHGAFCHRIRDDLEDAIRSASEIASLSCRYPGTRSWLRRLGRHAAPRIAHDSDCR